MLTLYKLKDVTRRASALLGAVTLLSGVVAASIPAAVFADALNPLTERSLTLSSSSPGWSYLDGSGNSTYAYPNSGANGQKTGNTYSFRVTSNATVKAITFQYCTTPAGDCIAPGNNTFDSHDVDASQSKFSTADGTGTLDFSSGSPTVTGTGGAQFKSELNVGSRIVTAGGNVYTVASIEGQTSLTLTTNGTDDDADDGAFKYRKGDTAGTSDLNIEMPSASLISNSNATPSDWAKIASGTDSAPAYTPDAGGSEGSFVVLTGDANGTVSGTGTGTITTTGSSATVTGNGTNFLTQLTEGAQITTAGGHTYTVLSIETATSLTLTEAVANADAEDGGGSGVTFTYANLGPASTYTSATDWAVTSSNAETGTLAAGTATGMKNYITMTSATGIAMEPQDYMKVVFYGTDNNYITNPGSGSFFVRINTYSDDQNVDDAHIIDGGVTVANVMNESITIQTKVLETMQFSVGTYDPDKYTNTQLTNVGMPANGQCNNLLMANPLDPSLSGSSDPAADYVALPHNVLKLGNPSNDYSLSTEEPYTVQSYWRLSSNSSGGATVYYTGHTLTNTEGDEIKPMPSVHTSSAHGNEQFGLGIAHDTDSTILAGAGIGETYPVWENDSPLYDSYGALETGDGTFGSFLFDNYSVNDAPFDTLAGNDAFAHYPRLYPLVPLAPYDNAAGEPEVDSPEYAFNSHADTYAQPIATEATDVVNCVTAKMRYIANIAPTTPAGLYTTKINYVASPQY